VTEERHHPSTWDLSELEAMWAERRERVRKAKAGIDPELLKRLDDPVIRAFIEGTPIDRALDRAAQEVVRLYRRHGLMLAGWDDQTGEVIDIDAWTVKLPEDEVDQR